MTKVTCSPPLTSIVVKMLESLVCDKIRYHLLTNGLMFENQHGFSPGKSCATAFCEATTEWFATLDRRSSPTARIDLISVDYSQAFDSISHDVLISKLHKTYGIHASLLQWITSFLTGRRQCVVFRGVSSDLTNVLSGVPQGSVLGPLLFNIYANDLHLHLKSTIYAYAVGTFIFREIKTDNDISALQSDLDSLNWWSKNNSLQLNPSKCQVMCISRRRDKPVPSYSVNNTTLEICDRFRLLGVTASSDLSWNCHVNNITKSAINLLVLSELLRLSRTNMFCLNFTKLSFCQFLIIAHLFGMFTRIVMWKNWNKSSTVQPGWPFVNVGGSNNTKIDSKL